MVLLIISYFLKAVALHTCIYLIASLGSYFSLRTGDINLGGEGQVYLGGFLCAILLNKFDFMPPFFALPLVFVFCGICTSTLTLICTFLQNKKNINFLLSSFMISCATIPFIDSLITNTFRTSKGSLLATDFILPQFRLSLLVVVLITSFIYILCIKVFNKTNFGSQTQVYGIAPEFSTFVGFNTNKITYLSSAFSGFFHGVSGSLCITSIFYTCHKGFFFGFGWNALAVTLIAKSKPLLLLPSALFLSFLITISDQIAIFNNFDFDISSIIQAIVIFITAIPLIKKRGTK